MLGSGAFGITERLRLQHAGFLHHEDYLPHVQYLCLTLWAMSGLNWAVEELTMEEPNVTDILLLMLMYVLILFRVV